MVQRIPRRPPPSVRTATTLLPILLFLLVAVTSATLTLQSASQLFIDLQSCNASIASALASVECTFLTPSNITTRAQLLDIPCGDFNYPAEDSDATSIVPAGTADDGNGNGNGTNGTHNLVTATFLETGITALEKNDFVTNTTNATMATVTRTYCARIDLLHALSSDPSSPELSIFAKKVNVTVSYRYSSLADFSVYGMQVVEYRPETAGASALRTTDLRAFQCDESGARDDYAVNVGDTLHLCVVNPDAYDDLTGEYDPDRIVDGRVDAYLETIDYLGFEGREGMVVEPVEGGATDFITEFDCGVDDGMKCHVKTLMVPSVFDAFGGEPMKALGVVSVRFLDVDGGADGRRGLQGTDREGQWEDHRRRELQSLSITQDVVPFAVVFRLGPSTMAYTMQTDLDGARSEGFRKRCFRRWISLTLGVVVLTSWMTRHG